MANLFHDCHLAIPGSVLQKLVASKTGKRMVSVDGVALPQGAGSKEQPIYVIAEEGMIHDMRKMKDGLLNLLH